MASALSGYWEPHSSSVDFCEMNYLHSHRIVEPHNVWSSFLGVTAFGLLGLAKGNPTKEWRFFFMHIILTLIGIGSICLHGTLHWVFQSSDELPMIYLLLCFIFGCAESSAPIGKSNYPWLPAVMFTVAILNTAVYYTFQQLYWIFLATFASGTITIAIWLCMMIFGSSSSKNQHQPRGQEPKRIFLTGLASYVFLGLPSWTFDMLMCDSVNPIAQDLPGYLKGLTPHVIWHFAAGLGGYCVAMCLLCCRLETLKLLYNVKRILGVVPIVFLQNNEEKDLATKMKVN
mmetsp:Transcript_5103/g.7461  ORF Transcript_5103/g.7461 Transcript_5103/m.7461 type:complete len:287 (+) Transcript_5103:184-1044(+)